MNARTGSQPVRSPVTVKRASDREIVVTRTFNAPAHLVFEAWTKPELFRQWWVPKSAGMTLHSLEMDARTGGSYHFSFGPGADFFGTYLEVTPHTRIVWTNDEGENSSVTTVSFQEQGDKTLLVLHELYRSKEVRDAALASGAYDGMGETFGQLDEVLVTLDPKAGAS